MSYATDWKMKAKNEGWSFDWTQFISKSAQRASTWSNKATGVRVCRVLKVQSLELAQGPHLLFVLYCILIHALSKEQFNRESIPKRKAIELVRYPTDVAPSLSRVNVTPGRFRKESTIFRSWCFHTNSHCVQR